MGTESGSTGSVRPYGLAEDVPGVLRGMESTDEAVREEAMAWLYSLLCYRDNTRTSPAAPELIRLALHGPGHRAEVLELLANLANWAGPTDEQERCRRITTQSLPSLLHLTQDPDPAVREAVVVLIAACGQQDAPAPTPLLRDRLAAETYPRVRARIVTALGLLEPADGDWRRALLTDPEPRVALAAAEDLLRTTESPLPDALVDACARAYSAQPPEEREESETEGHLWPNLHQTFKGRLLEEPEAALRALSRGIPLAFEITARWRDRETDVLPWALHEAVGGTWDLYYLAQLTCALPSELHARVAEQMLPLLADDDLAKRARAVTVLARARMPVAIEEAVRLAEETPGAYDTLHAVRAVAEEFGAEALPVGRAVARQLGNAHSELVKVLPLFPEVAEDAVGQLAELLTRTGTGYPSAAVAVLAGLGPAAGDVAERALRDCVAAGAHSSVSAEAAVALHAVAGDPEPALSLLRREMSASASASAWTTILAGRLGPAAAPLLPFIEPLLAPSPYSGTRAEAALAVWRITGRTEDTVEPLARKALAWDRFYPGPPHPVLTLTEMGLLPRFAVAPLREGAESSRRIIHDHMCGDGPHPDDEMRAAVRTLLATAAVVD
ncbi:HEAT repeat domain-containing protein [Streptomyces sp. NPDC006872]|uniref:HEAT repeat domain-containing protein n=1 Tax=Streptomyces sp. NPDC006872 TaxID=3155720 RepID=UPI0033D9E6FE